RWMADYYLAPWGEIIKIALPAAIHLKGIRYLAITPAGREALKAGDAEGELRAILQRIARRKRIRRDSLINSLCGAGGENVLHPLLPRSRVERILSLLQEKGWTEPAWGGDTPPGRAPRLASLPSGLALQGASPLSHVPNPDQARALEEIGKALVGGRFVPFLLHGVTGSGKTEVYLQAMAQALACQRQALLLVPEIALTPQLIAQISGRFGERVAVFHSGLSPAQRLIQWRRIKGGQVEIAVGARSAIFAPFERLGLIVIDEEHESSYKQEEGPRYHARDVGLMRGKLTGATVILGSATPSLESFHNALHGKYRYLKLPHRVEGRPLPQVRMIDMRVERDERGRRPVLSSPLKEAIAVRLAQGEQVLLFLNRRGFAAFIQCLDCGFIFQCPHCDVSLTYHRAERVLKCHYCGERQPVADLCPQCRGTRLLPFGLGTQRIEREVRKTFPGACVARMDRDVTQRGPAAILEILQGLREQRIDILIGTQMVAKGHDYPGITLVGVISAEASLNIPDFRAAERTFQLLTQVAGRAGRGEIPGEVLIQTHTPLHYALACAVEHNYEEFYSQETLFRQKLRYPPYSRAIALMLECPQEAEGEKASHLLGELLRRQARTRKVKMLGPERAILSKLRNLYRWQIWFSGPDSRLLHEVVQEGVKSYRQSSASSRAVQIHIDVDPLDLLY
ncbi:MAG: primosomal protein N', partial [Candidatus Tectomicrobia bacterium]|nr:primosomal protein N' [Candidatus Tectomicrobia bacterium]